MGVGASFGSTTPAVPGEATRCHLTLENTGAGREAVRVTLLGDAAAWGWVTPATVELDPGQTASATVTVKLPRTGAPPPGPLEIVVSVTTGGDTLDPPVTAVGTLDVAPVVDLVVTLRPHTSSGRTAGRHRLVVENRGNAPLSATVTGEGEDVSIAVARPLITAGPGQSVETDVTARTGRRGLGAGAVTRPFTVAVHPEGAPPVTAEGVMESPAGGWSRRVAVGLLVLAVGGVAVGAVLSALAGGGDSQVSSTTSLPVVAPSDCPARDHLSPTANGQVRVGVRPSFDYTFLFVTRQGCQPVRVNPCEPVRYALNRRLASDADVADLTEAVGKLAAATGLRFERVADTDEDPKLVPRVRRQPDGTLSWPPIVIGWSHLGSGDDLRARGDVRSNPDVVVGGGGRPEIVDDVIVTGNLVLNLDAVTDTDTRTPVPHGFGVGVNWGRIMLHELAHVIGLGHVDSRTSIMNEELTKQTISSSEWGVGDLIGLRQLGQEGGCVTVPTIPLQGAPR